MKFGIVVFNQVEELDFVGPLEMLGMWGRFADVAEGADGALEIVIVAEGTAPVVGAHGLSINPQVSFADCPPLDYILVPGGQGTRTEVNNRAMTDFVARQAKACKAVLSVCTGSFVLHAAGLLGGKRATTHWASLQRLRDLGDVQVVEQRYVVDGNAWTSAGVSAGIDMTLAFIAHVAGDEAAGKAQFYAEYYPDGMRYGQAALDPQAPAYIKVG
jgi:transcriptional regulator GlxA family with amidase domain